MKRARAALLATALAGGPASTQTLPMPDSFVPPERLAHFRNCRAAVFYELDEDSSGSRGATRSLALALLDQINFVMAETLFGKPHGALDAQTERLRFAERWFLGFSRAIAETRERFSDPAERERTLMACAPGIWSIARLYIDGITAWRAQADRTPPMMAPDAAEAARERIERRLELSPPE